MASPDPVLSPEFLASEGRWRRWEQRGRDNDARFMRQAHKLLWATIVGFALVLVLLVVR